jgi:hypothetical protein
MKLKIVHNKIFYRSFGDVPNEFKGFDNENYKGFR